MSALPSPAAPASADQRQHRRRMLQTTAVMMVVGQAPLEVRTTDISLGGLGLVMLANPPANLGVRVRLALPMPSAQLLGVELNGRVVHSVLSRRYGGFAVGLALLSPSPEALRAIKAYLAT